MVDFHSHILPCVDDGSRDITESLELLKLLGEQGVKTVVATPHFYADLMTLAEFLTLRSESYKALKEHFCSDYPKVLLGAEVRYYPGISRLEGIEQLCVDGTNILLLEMPFEKWTSLTIREVIELSNRKNLTIVLAHIDRYLSFQSSDTLNYLMENGLLIQANSDFFLQRFTRRKAIKLLKNGAIHFLGSDCHNIVTRPPRIDEAVSIIEKYLGNKYIALLSDFAAERLNQI